MSASNRVYQLKAVEELFSQEQALMGHLQNAAKSHEDQRNLAEAATKASRELLGQAQQAIDKDAMAQKDHDWPRFLDMPNPELCKNNPPTDVVAGLRGLRNQLEGLQADMGSVWPGIFSDLVSKTVAKATAIDNQLLNIEAVPRGDQGIALLPQPMLVRLEVLSGLGSNLDTQASIDTVASLHAQLKDLSTAQVMKMEPSTAGQVGWAKVQLQTKLVENLKNLIRCIESTEMENSKLSNLAEIRVVAEQQSAQIKEPRMRLKRQCEAALNSVKLAMQSMEHAHSVESAQYQGQMDLSQQKLAANEEKQAAIWAKMSEMYEELGALTLERSGETQWQVEASDKECRRREEYKWSVQVASEHLRMLSENVRNCDAAIDCLDMTAQFVAEGTETAARYQEATAVDLNTQKNTLISEVEQALATLHSWTTEHRMFVQDELHANRYVGAAGSPVRLPAYGGAPAAAPAPLPLQAPPTPGHQDAATAQAAALRQAHTAAAAAAAAAGGQYLPFPAR